jgi:thiamine-phosphate pyrophosphorylase
VLSYYITDRMQFAGSEVERKARLLRTIARAVAAGVDYVQLREKDLSIRELEMLAVEALRIMRGEGEARLLINHRTDVALAAGADGVHLTGDDISASEARALAAKVRAGHFVVATSCHSAREVRMAESHGADFVVLAPIFEKANVVKDGIGLDALRAAAQKDRAPDLRVEAGDTRRRFAVFALGGVSLERAAECAAAGAAGVAGIRLFQECEDLDALVGAIRKL